MNLPLTQRLQPLLVRAAEQKDNAARALQHQQAALSARQDRLGALQDFANQYGSLERAHSTAALMNQHAFLERLRDAVRQQVDLVQTAETRADQARSAWQGRHQRCEALNQLCALDAQRERRKAERKDQRQLDDLATRQFLARREEATR